MRGLARSAAVRGARAPLHRALAAQLRAGVAASADQRSLGRRPPAGRGLRPAGRLDARTCATRPSSAPSPPTSRSRRCPTPRTRARFSPSSRIYAPVSGNATVTWADVTPDDPGVAPHGAEQPLLVCAVRAELRLADRFPLRRRSRRGQQSLAPGNTRGLTLPGEPFGLAQSQDGTRARGDQRDGDRDVAPHQRASGPPSVLAPAAGHAVHPPGRAQRGGRRGGRSPRSAGGLHALRGRPRSAAVRPPGLSQTTGTAPSSISSATTTTRERPCGDPSSRRSARTPSTRTSPGRTRAESPSTPPSASPARRSPG